ncbi:MAG TPA: hypothetical protein VF443_15970 [Nitrospira sp.]
MIAKALRPSEEAGELPCDEPGIIIAEFIGMKLKSFMLILALLGLAAAVSRFDQPTLSVADVEVVPGLVGEPDQALMRDVVAAFDQADAAVRQADIESLMPFYARGYNYYGLMPADVRRIWAEVFVHYRDLGSRHVFTDVKLIQTGTVKKAAVTCTGGLYGIDKESGKTITIDSWASEVHYLIYENGAWRFLGNKGGITESVPPSSAPHHPLF